MPYRIYWKEVKTPLQVADYYKERLGKYGEAPPGVQCAPIALKALTAEGGILERMECEAPDAWWEFKVIDARSINGSFVLYFDIDPENPGGRLIDFFRRHAHSQIEQEMLKSLLETSALCKAIRIQALRAHSATGAIVPVPPFPLPSSG